MKLQALSWQNSPWMKATRPQWRYALRNGIAMCLALTVAYYLNLDEPYWAMTSAAVVSFPTVGGVISKSFGRIAGSLLGGFSGMEMLIIASLAVSGVMMFKTENRLLLAVPALAMFHGWAHGVEMSGHSFWLFTSGFMFASATVLCASFAAGLLLRRHDGLRKTFGGGLIVSALLALMS